MVLKLLVVIIQVCTVYSAPLLQLLPYQNAIQRSQLLQQQLMELQGSQQWNPFLQVPAAPLNTMAGPIIVLLPDDRIPNIKDLNTHRNDVLNKRINDRHENEFENTNKETEEDSDSVIINAEPIPTIDGPRKALLILPNARLSIGDFISSIPFLPIEINVPDTISWMYNGIADGISSIISIIGQSRPFQRPLQSTEVIKLKSNGIPISNINTPIIVIPFNGMNPFLKPKM